MESFLTPQNAKTPSFGGKILFGKGGPNKVQPSKITPPQCSPSLISTKEPCSENSTSNLGTLWKTNILKLENTSLKKKKNIDPNQQFWGSILIFAEGTHIIGTLHGLFFNERIPLLFLSKDPKFISIQPSKWPQRPTVKPHLSL